ncbi:anti sigma factor C-terminal domain-containing protein [Planococcus sp. N028]|uniref:Anti sigma factor C-terminal domain-containing protein n=1 Tax=Planococcus shixiaomingii TaxID=3058393 RepID=A0ABT8MZ59_9BACL|nr:anti sigma factor C-terminal domain-containing protein [Planococcus sp. N028]MDN7240894.1 anti sigma factor C-terminal domain-containing protein [Planococcus sp. N028]
MSEKNELFPKDTDFSNLVKKARRKSLLRNIVVSVIVSCLLFAGLFWLGTFMMYKKIDEDISYDYAWRSIQGANVQSTGSDFNYTPFSVSVITGSNKYVAGVPLPWENLEKVFSIFGSSRIVQSNSISGTGSIEDKRIPLYFQGERVIEFYAPGENYDFLPDDRPLLDEIAEYQVVEMAYSFDAGYSLEEVEAIFSDQSNWYWVGGISTPDNQPVYGGNAYGFHKNRDPIESANGFIQQLKWLQEEKGDSQQEAKRLYDTLTDKGQIELKPESLRLFGIVVTGTAEELKQFNGSPMIRAAVLGATTDKY